MSFCFPSCFFVVQLPPHLLLWAHRETADHAQCGPARGPDPQAVVQFKEIVAIVVGSAVCAAAPPEIGIEQVGGVLPQFKRARGWCSF